MDNQNKFFIACLSGIHFPKGFNDVVTSALILFNFELLSQYHIVSVNVCPMDSMVK